VRRVRDDPRQHGGDALRARQPREERQRREHPAERHEQQRVREPAMLLDRQQRIGCAADEDVDIGKERRRRADQQRAAVDASAGDRPAEGCSGEGVCQRIHG
jgi:hypothetical protein